MKKIPLILFALLISLFSFLGCDKDEDKNLKPEIPQANEINTFIWSGLHDLYLWNENVPNLTNPNYNNNEDSLNSFLNKYEDHEELFYDLLYDYGKTDKFSWIVDDYEELEKEFQGITKSMGYNFMPVRYGANNNVLAYVRYVVKGSPAALGGLKRGDIITSINGQTITLNNYRDLLYAESQILGFSQIVSNTIVPDNSRTAVTLSAVEITENPIFLDTVYSVGSQKIGYLIYNSFTSNFDKQLNGVFLKFKNAGINKLILDLRYNLGGSLESSTYLASMIYGTHTTKVFLKTQFNNILQNYYNQQLGPDYFNVYFESNIENTDKSKTPINTLNFQEVYVITSDHTASASESIINGLKPYMNVVTVGTQTLGKYVGSFTIKDIIDDKGTVNPNHKWAMQPITLKITNSAGVSDYVNGLAPNIEVEEDLRILSVLGSLDEPLLKATVSAITGVSSKSAKAPWDVQTEKLEIRNIEKESQMYIKTPAILPR